jgi:hypothetical protein
MGNGGMTMKCSLCKKEAIDSTDVECGNNAEYSITLNLCHSHCHEYEKLGYEFEEKYGKEIQCILDNKLPWGE